MKILLLAPPSTIYGKDPTVPGITPPLGIAYIAAYLVQHGYEVELLDTVALGGSEPTSALGDVWVRYGITDEEVLKKLEGIRPDVVGITCMYTAYAGDAHRLAKVVKSYNPEIPVIFGGAHPSTFPEFVLKDKNVDLVVQGEGEQTVLEIMRHLERKEDILSTPGTVVRSNGNTLVNPSRGYVSDLDTLPFPARDLLDMDIYKEATMKEGYILRKPSTTIVTSRGCPGKCIFCTIHSVWGRKWRYRSARNVVDEMEMLKRDFGIREVHWVDDSAGIKKTRVHEICDEILSRRLDITWATPNGIAHWTLDEKTLDRMREAGCYRITFGIESGNEETRKFLGKPYSLKQAERLIKHANSIGMWTICTLILGFPYEKEDSIRDTVDFAVRSEVDMALFYLLAPFPGTPVYEIFKKEGLVNYDDILNMFGEAENPEDFERIGRALSGRGVRTVYFTEEQLNDFLTEAYKSFFRARVKSYLNPLRVIRKIRSVEDFIYFCRLSKSMALPMLRFLRQGKFTQQMFRRAVE